MLRIPGEMERRAATRYDAQGCVTMGWWQGTEFQSEPIAMLDISQGGIRGMVARNPEPDVPVWIMVPVAVEPRWIRSTILGISRPRKSPIVIRLRFDEDCPYDLFRHSLRGAKLQAELPAPTESHWRDASLWR